MLQLVLLFALNAAPAAPPNAKPEPAPGDQLVLIMDDHNPLTGGGGTGHVTGTIGTLGFDARDDGVPPDFVLGDGIYTIVARDLKGTLVIEIVARGMRWSGSADFTQVTAHEPLAVELQPDGTFFAHRAVPGERPPNPSEVTPPAGPDAEAGPAVPLPAAGTTLLMSGVLAVLGLVALAALALRMTRRRR